MYPEIGDPQNGRFILKSDWYCMIWGCPSFKKTWYPSLLPQRFTKQSGKNCGRKRWWCSVSKRALLKGIISLTILKTKLRIGIGMDLLVGSLVGHMGSSQSMNVDQLFCSAFFRHSSYHLVTDVTVPLVAPEWPPRPPFYKPYLLTHPRPQNLVNTAFRTFSTSKFRASV